MKIIFILCTSMLLWGEVFAQNEYNYWMFFEGGGLDFNYSPPKQVLRSSLEFSGFGYYTGVSSIADVEGNLLYYSDGHKIFDGNHELVSNGNLSPDSIQTVSPPLFVPLPNTLDKHLLFYSKVKEDDSLGYIGQLYYAELTIDSGNSKINIRDSLLFEGNFSFRINGIKISCDTSLIVISDFIGDITYIFPVTIDGVQTEYIVENTSIVSLSNNLSKSYFRDPFDFHRSWLIQDFDINTFTQSNKIRLYAQDSLYIFLTMASMAPNGTKFYTIEYDAIPDITNISNFGQGYTILHSYLFQFDLTAGDENAIQNSKKLIYKHEGDYLFNSQLGPDGKIYISGGWGETSEYILYENTLHVIHFPELPGPECNFEPNYIGINASLEPFLQNYMYNTIAPDFNFDNNSECTGIPIQFSGFNFENYPADYSWDFDDPTSGPDNFSNEQNPSHIFSEPGEYLVRMEPGCIQKKLYITPPPKVNLGPDTVMCLNDPLLLTLKDENLFTEYEWSPPSILGDSSYAYQGGVYWVRGTNGCGTDIDSIVVTRIEAIDLYFESSGVCDDEEVAFTSTVSDVPDEYIWDFGDPESGPDNISNQANPNHMFSSPGEYMVTLKLMKSICEVGETDTTLFIEDRPEPDLGPDQTVCFDEEVILDAGNYLSPVSYLWSNGANTSSVKAEEPGWYKVTAENRCDTVVDSIYVDIIPKILALIPDDTVVCDGNFALLDAGNVHPLISYQWNDGSSDQVLNVQKPGKYWVEISSECNTVVDSVNLYFIREDFGMEAPNVITPNGDGINDLFKIYSLDNPEYQLTIFNRYGKVVFQTKDRFEYWDGTYNGAYVAPGIYYWAVHGRDCDYGDKVYKGWLSVLGTGIGYESY